MKFKTFVLPIVLVLLLAALLFAPQLTTAIGMAQVDVPLPLVVPDPVVLLLAAGVGYLVTNGLKSAFPNIDLSGLAAKWTAAIVTIIVSGANVLLEYIPAQFHSVVTVIFTLVIAVFGAYGLHYSVKTRGAGTPR